MIKLRLAAAAALVSVGAVAPAAAQDIFLDIPGVGGSATGAPYPGKIQVLSFSFGLGGAAADKDGRSSQSCVGQDIFVTKPLDQASADLVIAAATGRSFQTAKLIATRVDGAGRVVPAFELVMANVTVSSFQTGASEGSGPPVEQIAFDYASLTGTVYTQDDRGASIPEAFTALCR